MTTLPFNSYRLSPAARGALLSWHERLHKEAAQGLDRADRAVLRRAHDLQAVVESAAYQRVYQKMANAHQGEPWRPYEQDRIAVLVALLAHIQTIAEVKADDYLPRVMGRASAGDKAAVSELRFRRILEALDMESLFTGLRRVLPIVSAQADSSRLIDDIFGWGDTVKRRWAYAYYGAGSQ